MKRGKKIIYYLEKAWLPVLLGVTALGLFLRWQGIWLESPDYINAISIWMRGLSESGGLQVLPKFTGDYNMPYMTVLLFLTYLPVPHIILVKSLSIVFDVICAAAGGFIAVLCKNQGSRRLTFLLTYTVIFLSPVAVLNSGFWAQCDSIYVAFVLLACLCMLKEKFPAAMCLWGCAFAFKLQAVFGFPILVLYYWKNRKFSAWQFFLIPIVMEVLCIPAIIGGCSPLTTLKIYFAQLNTFPEMYYYYPNFWTFFQEAPYYHFGLPAVAGTLVLVMLIAVYALKKEKTFGSHNFLPYFIWLVMTIVCFLPCMHERYGYMLEIAAFIWAVVDKRKWWLSITLQIITLFMYAPLVLDRYLIDARILAVVYLLAYLLLVHGLIGRQQAEENALEERQGEYV